MDRGGKERREGGGERENKDGGGGGGRRPLGKIRQTDADGVQGGQTCRGGGVAGGGDDNEGEGGVSGNRAGGSSVENPKSNTPSPISGDTTP